MRFRSVYLALLSCILFLGMARSVHAQFSASASAWFDSGTRRVYLTAQNEVPQGYMAYLQGIYLSLPSGHNEYYVNYQAQEFVSFGEWFSADYEGVGNYQIDVFDCYAEAYYNPVTGYWPQYGLTVAEGGVEASVWAE